MSVTCEIRNVLEPTVFELSHPGRTGYRLPELDVPEVDLEEAFGASFLRDAVIAEQQDAVVVDRAEDAPDQLLAAGDGCSRIRRRPHRIA